MAEFQDEDIIALNAEAVQLVDSHQETIENLLERIGQLEPTGIKSDIDPSEDPEDERERLLALRDEVQWGLGQLPSLRELLYAEHTAYQAYVRQLPSTERLREQHMKNYKAFLARVKYNSAVLRLSGLFRTLRKAVPPIQKSIRQLEADLDAAASRSATPDPQGAPLFVPVATAATGVPTVTTATTTTTTTTSTMVTDSASGGSFRTGVPRRSTPAAQGQPSCGGAAAPPHTPGGSLDQEIDFGGTATLFQHFRLTSQRVSTASSTPRPPTPPPPLQVDATGKPLKPTSAAAGSVDHGADFSLYGSNPFYRNSTVQLPIKSTSSSRSPNEPTAPPLPTPKSLYGKFSGDILAYPAWRDAFIRMVHAPGRHMEDADRLAHLVDGLDGQPLQLARALARSSSSYHQITAQIETDYYQPTVCIDRLYRHLEQMHTPAATPAELRRFADEVIGLCGVLSSFGIDVTTEHLAYIKVMAKLPNSVRLEMLRTKHHHAKWTLETALVELKNVLRWQADAAAFALPAGPSKSHQSALAGVRDCDSASTDENGGPIIQHVETTLGGGFLGAPVQRKQEGPRLLSCCFCGYKDHYGTRCPVFDSVNSRIERARKLNYCFLCLRQDHYISNQPCRAKNDLCVHCKKHRHHRALCITYMGHPPRRFAGDRRQQKVAAAPFGPRQGGVRSFQTSQPHQTNTSGRTERPPHSTADKERTSGGAELQRSSGRRGHQKGRRPRQNHHQNATYAANGTTEDAADGSQVSARTAADLPDAAAPVHRHQPTPAVVNDDVGSVGHDSDAPTDPDTEDEQLDSEADPIDGFGGFGAAAPSTKIKTTTIRPTHLLECLQAEVCHPDKRQPTRRATIFFDSGSSLSYVSSQLAEFLGLRNQGPCKLTLDTFAQDQQTKLDAFDTQLGLKLASGKLRVIDVKATPTQVVSRLRSAFISDADVVQLRHNQCPIVPEDVQPDVVIGRNMQHHFRKQDLRPLLPSGFCLVSTTLGPMIAGEGYLQGTGGAAASHAATAASVSATGGTPPGCTSAAAAAEGGSRCAGRTPSSSTSAPIGYGITTYGFYSRVNEEESLCDLAENFWRTENISIEPNNPTPDDILVHKRFEKTTVVDSEGRYQVRLPWKTANGEPPTNAELPTNFGMARGRLTSFQNAHRDEPDFLLAYGKLFEDMEREGVIEQFDPGERNSALLHFLAHHAVVKEASSTTKVRAVFDGSARVSGKPSINDMLHRGPVLLPKMIDVQLQSRLYETLILGDIAKAFLQISIHPDDRSACAFLGLKDWLKPPTDDNLLFYRFRRVTFGLKPSPFLLGGAVEMHLKQIGTPLADEIWHNCYVDNVVMGADSLDEAMQKYKLSKEYFAAAKMQLRQFASNCQAFNEKIPPDDRADLNHVMNLGYQWDLASDCYQISLAPKEKKTPDRRKKHVDQSLLTKRSMLQRIARIFDPHGFLQPILLPLKLQVQEMWKDSPDSWDAPAPDHVAETWNDYIQHFEDVTITIPRRVAPVKLHRVQLHIFVDASKDAYGLAAYLRTTGKDGRNYVSLILSRSKVKPLKESEQMTIPRMELMAMTLGARAAAFLKDCLKLQAVEKIILWSDSMIVLQQLRSVERTKEIFVENRLTTIRDLQRSVDFETRYINTAENPADLVSRGLHASELQACSLWWHAAPFLVKQESEWPPQPTVLLSKNPTSDMDSMDAQPPSENGTPFFAGCMANVISIDYSSASTSATKDTNRSRTRSRRQPRNASAFPATGANTIAIPSTSGQNTAEKRPSTRRTAAGAAAPPALPPMPTVFLLPPGTHHYHIRFVEDKPKVDAAASHRRCRSAVSSKQKKHQVKRGAAASRSTSLPRKQFGKKHRDGTPSRVLQSGLAIVTSIKNPLDTSEPAKDVGPEDDRFTAPYFAGALRDCQRRADAQLPRTELLTTELVKTHLIGTTWSKVVRIYAYVLRAAAAFLRAVRRRKTPTEAPLFFDCKEQFNTNCPHAEQVVRTRTTHKFCGAQLYTATERNIAAAMALWQAQRAHPPTKEQRQRLRIVEHNGLFYVKGRLDNSGLTAAAVTPLFLPRQSPITPLIIYEYHLANLHAGTTTTLANVRVRYWFTHGRRTIASAVRLHCVACRKLKNPAYSIPFYPVLPTARVTSSRPFCRVGVDFYGPVPLKLQREKPVIPAVLKNHSERAAARSKNAKKAEDPKFYVCLFTCLYTRAVHCELTMDLTTEQFFHAFKRFAARRSWPEEVLSDNGSTFVAARQTIATILARARGRTRSSARVPPAAGINTAVLPADQPVALRTRARRGGCGAESGASARTRAEGSSCSFPHFLASAVAEDPGDEVSTFFIANNIVWRTITERAAWRGGCYERMIGLIKACLSKTLGRTRPTVEEYRTLLAQAEWVVNCRPLTYIHDSEREASLVRPVDFLIPSLQGHCPSSCLDMPADDEDRSDPDFVPATAADKFQRRLLGNLQHSTRLIDHFHRLWRDGYLLELRREFGRGSQACEPYVPAVGDVVIVYDDNLPRCEWRYALVLELQPSSDGVVRTAKIRLSHTGHETTRAVNHLYPLKPLPPYPRAVPCVSNTCQPEAAAADSVTAQFVNASVSEMSSERMDTSNIASGNTDHDSDLEIMDVDQQPSSGLKGQASGTPLAGNPCGNGTPAAAATGKVGGAAAPPSGSKSTPKVINTRPTRSAEEERKAIRRESELNAKNLRKKTIKNVFVPMDDGWETHRFDPAVGKPVPIDDENSRRRRESASPSPQRKLRSQVVVPAHSTVKQLLLREPEPTSSDYSQSAHHRGKDKDSDRRHASRSKSKDRKKNSTPSTSSSPGSTKRKSAAAAADGAGGKNPKAKRSKTNNAALGFPPGRTSAHSRMQGELFPLDKVMRLLQGKNSKPRAAARRDAVIPMVDTNIRKDLMTSEIRNTPTGGFPRIHTEWLNIVDEEFEFAFAIAHFVHPASYCSEQLLPGVDVTSVTTLVQCSLDNASYNNSLIRGAVFGIHPHVAYLGTVPVRQALKGVIINSGVDDFKSCGMLAGFDYTPPTHEKNIRAIPWRNESEMHRDQSIVFTDLVKFAVGLHHDGIHRPLCLILKSRNKGAFDAVAEAFALLRKMSLPSTYPIYLMSWDGTPAQAWEWLRYFPNSRFGFHHDLVTRKTDPENVFLKRELPLEHIFLESGSPRTRSDGRLALSIDVFDLARTLEKQFHEDKAHILEQTATAALHFFFPRSSRPANWTTTISRQHPPRALQLQDALAREQQRPRRELAPGRRPPPAGPSDKNPMDTTKKERKDTSFIGKKKTSLGDAIDFLATTESFAQYLQNEFSPHYTTAQEKELFGFDARFADKPLKECVLRYKDGRILQRKTTADTAAAGGSTELRAEASSSGQSQSESDKPQTESDAGAAAPAQTHRKPCPQNDQISALLKKLATSKPSAAAAPTTTTQQTPLPRQPAFTASPQKASPSTSATIQPSTPAPSHPPYDDSRPDTTTLVPRTQLRPPVNEAPYGFDVHDTNTGWEPLRDCTDADHHDPHMMLEEAINDFKRLCGGAKVPQDRRINGRLVIRSFGAMFWIQWAHRFHWLPKKTPGDETEARRPNLWVLDFMNAVLSRPARELPAAVNRFFDRIVEEFPQPYFHIGDFRLAILRWYESCDRAAAYLHVHFTGPIRFEPSFLEACDPNIYQLYTDAEREFFGDAMDQVRLRLYMVSCRRHPRWTRPQEAARLRAPAKPVKITTDFNDILDSTKIVFTDTWGDLFTDNLRPDVQVVQLPGLATEAVPIATKFYYGRNVREVYWFWGRDNLRNGPANINDALNAIAQHITRNFVHVRFFAVVPPYLPTQHARWNSNVRRGILESLNQAYAHTTILLHPTDLRLAEFYDACHKLRPPVNPPWPSTEQRSDGTPSEEGLLLRKRVMRVIYGVELWLTESVDPEEDQARHEADLEAINAMLDQDVNISPNNTTDMDTSNAGGTPPAADTTPNKDASEEQMETEPAAAGSEGTTIPSTGPSGVLGTPKMPRRLQLVTLPPQQSPLDPAVQLFQNLLQLPSAQPNLTVTVEALAALFPGISSERAQQLHAEFLQLQGHFYALAPTTSSAATASSVQTTNTDQGTTTDPEEEHSSVRPEEPSSKDDDEHSYEHVEDENSRHSDDSDLEDEERDSAHSDEEEEEPSTTEDSQPTESTSREAAPSNSRDNSDPYDHEGAVGDSDW